MIVIFFVDLNTHFIYDVTLWALFITASVWTVLNQVWLTHLIWAAGAGLFFYILAFLGEKIYRKQALGEGDIPLAAAIALLAGSQMTLISFYAAFILGGAAAVFLLLTGKAKRGSELPFAPFLISGWALAVLIHAL
jgi:leader peptidase (prepilin peptidase)/N-methyltransferase